MRTQGGQTPPPPSPTVTVTPGTFCSSQGLPPGSVGDEPSFTVRNRHRIWGFCEDICCYIPSSTEEAFPVPKSSSSAPFTPSTHTSVHAGKKAGTQGSQGLKPVLGSSRGRQAGGSEGQSRGAVRECGMRCVRDWGVAGTSFISDYY